MSVPLILRGSLLEHEEDVDLGLPGKTAVKWKH